MYSAIIATAEQNNEVYLNIQLNTVQQEILHICRVVYFYRVCLYPVKLCEAIFPPKQGWEV